MKQRVKNLKGSKNFPYPLYIHCMNMCVNISDFHPPLLSSPFFSAHTNWSRQMAAENESGSARGFFQLMSEFSSFHSRQSAALCGNC